MKVNISYKDFDKSIRKLISGLDEQARQRVAGFAGEWVLGVAQEHAPVGASGGTLAASANSQPYENGVEIGFNTEYATVQDLGFKNETVKVRKKRMLYVPISDKGQRYHTLGKNPNDEGLQYGVDYVLKKQVHVPNKSYGSKKGPNKYFSETLEQNRDAVIEEIRDGLIREVSKLL